MLGAFAPPLEGSEVGVAFRRGVASRAHPGLSHRRGPMFMLHGQYVFLPFEPA